MLGSILAAISNWIIHVIETLGYAGIVILMAVESAAIPLPSEVIMPFSGFLVFEGRFSLHGIALAGAFGSLIGSWVTYWLGRYGGRPLIRRYGRFVFLSEHDLVTADRFFSRYGMWAVFLGRVLPIVRTYISIPAGISQYKFLPFTITAFVGSYIWSWFLGWIGFKLGENWQEIRVVFRQVDWLIGILIIISAAWWIRRHIRNRIKT